MKMFYKFCSLDVLLIRKNSAFLLLFLCCTLSCQTDDVIPETNYESIIVETSTPTAISAYSAKVGGILSASQERKNIIYGVCIDIKQEPTIASSKALGGLGTFTHLLSNLKPATTYYVRAYATNSVETVYGIQQIFTTLATYSTLTTNSVSNVTSTTATCGGTITSDGGATVTSRGVCWSASNNPTISLSTKTVDGSEIGYFTSYLSGLQPGITYYVRAYATNSVGTVYGSLQVFTTVLPTVILTTTEVIGITSFSASCGGNIASDGGSMVLSRGSCWSTISNPTVSLSTKTIDGSGTGSFNSSLTGLKPETIYYVRAYATNSFGTVYGPQQIFTTTSVVTIETGSATNIAAGSFIVSATLTNSGLVSEWGIVMDISDPSDPSSGHYDKFSIVADGSCTLTYKSSANSKYYYSAYVRLKTGAYLYGDICWVKTKAY